VEKRREKREREKGKGKSSLSMGQSSEVSRQKGEQVEAEDVTDGREETPVWPAGEAGVNINQEMMQSFNQFLQAREPDNHSNSRPQLFITSIYRNMKFTITLVMCVIFIVSIVFRQISESKFLSDLYKNICKSSALEQ